MSMSKKTALIDGDIYAYKICSAAEHEIFWDDQHHTLYSDRAECIQSFERFVAKVERDLSTDNVIIAFSDSSNFRKEIYSDYKGNRKGNRKPLAYKSLVDHIKNTYNTKQMNNLEADDVLGILATGDWIKGEKVIVSGDKDFMQIPATIYNPDKGSLTKVTMDEANYWFARQTLTGDTVDNYPGCPGIGEKRAEGIIRLGMNPKQLWDAVVRTYENAGLDERYALTQARCARILRAEDYDFKHKVPVLWGL